MMIQAVPQSETFGEFPADPAPLPAARRPSLPTEPLDDRAIGAALVRMGVIGSQEKLRCEPLDGGVSSEIWRVDVPGRRLTLHVPDEELARRRAAWTPPPPAFTRGYGRLYLDHVLQAPEGADFDFLRGGPGRDWTPYEPTSH